MDTGFPTIRAGAVPTEVLKPELRDLGPIHFGRKEDQPTRDELREFFREGEPLLNHDIVWFDNEMRAAVACAFAQIIKQHGYTCWACAILRNHAHAVVRTYKSADSEEMWRQFAEAAAQVLHTFSAYSADHPVWSNRPYKVYLYSRASVRTRIGYVERNPAKEGLPPQHWDFVTRCPWM